MFLICYDISPNSIRNRLSNLLIQFGFERVQKSVFIGIEHPALYAPVKKILESITDEEGKILIIKLTLSHLQNMEFYGTFNFDKEYLLGNQSSLIF